MNFQDFLNNIINSFNNFINHVPQIINIIIQDNFIKLLIYLTIFSTLITFTIYIINLFKNIINFNKKDKNKEVE